MKNSTIVAALVIVAVSCGGARDSAVGALRSTASPLAGSLNAADGTMYYVGQSGCSDAGPGDEQTPFCSFGEAVSHLSAGDTLVVKAGTYTERLKLNALAGQVDAPVVIRGDSRDGVVFDGGCPGFPCSINDVDQDEWWELVQWATVEGMIDIQGSSFITLRDLTVRNVIAAGVNVYGGAGIAVENIVVDGTGNNGLLLEQTSNLTVTDNDIGRAQLGFRDENGDLHVGYHEALSVVGVSQFVVAHNYVHDTPKEGIDVKESSSGGEVYDNFVERACAVGIYINEADSVQVYDNRVRRSGYILADGGGEAPCSSDPVFGGLYGQYFGGGILLAVGDLGELSQGVLSNISVYRNVVWDSYNNALEFWDELRESGSGQGLMTGNLVYNNVFYNSGLAGMRLDDVQNSVFANNIIALNQEEGVTGDAIGVNTVSHNLFQLRYGWHEPVGTDYVVGDPLFVDPASGDFQLQAASPAIDNGLDMGLPYAGAAPDIGAYEYGLVSPTPTPTPAATVDTDGDGCADSEEAAGAALPKPGATGAFDPSNPLDFFDVPVPANADPIPNGTRNRLINMGDVLAVLLYFGANDGNPPNGNGVDYDSDKDGDTAEDGRAYDRSVSPGPNPPWDAGPPNGAINTEDVLAVVAQVGLDCSGPP